MRDLEKKRAYDRAYERASYAQQKADPEQHADLLAKERERDRERYQRKKQTDIGKAKVTRKTMRNPTLRRRRKDWVIAYKRGLSCVRCGFSHPAALDFHHRDPATKTLAVARLVLLERPRTEIEAEIAKCDVMCANCHRIEHFGVYYENAHRRANGSDVTG